MRYLVLFLLFFSAVTHANKLYQWVDDEGVTHYTQTPPPVYIGAEERTIDVPKPKQQAVEQAENTDDPLQALKQKRAENCKRAQENLATLTSDQEVYTVVEGETEEETLQKIPMTIEQRRQEMTKTQKYITDFCQTTEEDTAEAEQE